VDPAAKLIPSAKRLYGWKLRFVWGRMQPVSAGQAMVPKHGETIRVGDLETVAWYTPGHARHHLAWQIGDSVVTGDVAGVRFPGSDYVLPPTPPPDIDIDDWCSSLDLIRGLGPRRLLLTHFGTVGDVDRHLDELEGRLRRWEGLAREEVAAGGSRERLTERLREFDDEQAAAAGVPDALIQRHRRLCPVGDNAAGLHRHASKLAAE
jgi:glyoxylase-like metal-dependent hydrolase (beta-lactamase superfamily II)